MKNKLAAWIALALIAVVAAALLATTNEVTKDVIEAQNVEAMQAAWAELVPGAAFPDGIAAAESEEGVPGEYVYAGLAEGEPVGYVAQVVTQGYGGPVEVIVGTDTEGTINGIKVGGANFKETAGLGAKAKEPAFTSQFAGLTAPLSVGENVDAITASTITSNAVVRAVNTAMENIAPVAGFTIDTPAAEAGEIGDGRYAASTKGFAGPVYVEIQLDGSNTITEIVIGDDQFAETAGYGLKAQEPAFYEQFIGKSGQLVLGEDIDAIAGATITSNAVVDAVNTAMLFATDPEAAAALMGAKEEFVLPEVPVDALTETASRKGFAGAVAATITIDKDTHEILRVEFGDDAWAETDGIGSKVKEDDFWQQFIGKTLPLEDGEIDLITGATVTSQAAFEAVNKAYSKLFPQEEAEGGEAGADAAVDPNRAEASSKGYNGPVAAQIAVDDAGVITEITFGSDKFAETEGLGTKVLEDDFAAQFVGKALPLAAGDIDIITGATVSSEAAIAAVNKAYDKIQEARGMAMDIADGNINEETAANTAITGTATASSKGYNGPVAAEITVEAGVLTAVTFGDDAFAETDGLGTKVLEDDFAAQFVGKVLPLADGAIDTITGATVSREAAIAAVNKAFGKIEPSEVAIESLAGTANGTAKASSKGFNGPVAAEITVEAGVLTAVTFGDELFAETDGLGTKILEDDFSAQFIGKNLPVALDDIDAVAGATVTSEAAVSAVNKAFEKVVTEPAEGVEAIAPVAAFSGTAKASSKGFNGPVAAEITVEGGVLTAVTFGDDAFAETDGLGTKILEEDFAAQFVGQALPLADGAIDTITGATVTSEAAIAAVNKAYDKLAPTQEDVPAEETPVAEETAVNTAEASAKGYNGPVQVSITIDENDALTGVVIGGELFAETEGLGTKVLEDDFAALFVGKSLPLAKGDIDTITGATVTSEAAIAAVNKAYEKILEMRCEAAGAEETAAVSGTEKASSKGYNGPVQVEITVENGVLTGVVIGGDLFAETEGLGTKVLEDGFAALFVGKALPLADGDVDAIAGATVSSEAAISAVNKAYEKLLAQSN